MSEYSDIIDHSSMVFDLVRNRAYEKAILEKITPDSVVLDLGAGLGIHGLIAAKAGAKKVYLVDPSPAVLVAKEIAKDNQFDNVVCLQTTIEKADIEEKIDMIISVFTGNFLLTEDLLPSLFYARDKYLAPDGVLIPSRAKMIVVPVSMADFYANNIDSWDSAQHKNSVKAHFDIDYRNAKKYALNRFFYQSFKKEEATFLSEPHAINELDFYQCEKAECFSQTETTITDSDTCHGWQGWFDIELGSQWLSTSPQAEATHWSQVFLPLPSPTDVTAGDKIDFALKRPEFGDWSWNTRFLNQNIEFNQSTFLSRTFTPKQIIKQSPAYKPVLSDEGKALKLVCDLFDGEHSTDSIANQLYVAFPKQFSDLKLALEYVKSHAQKIG